MAISAADIMLKILNNRLYRQKKGLYPDHIESVLPEFPSKVNAHFLGEKFLHQTTPQFPTQINLIGKIRHPVVFLIREYISSLVPRDATESSLLWKCAQNFASKIDGCVKLFDPSTDYRIMTNQDFLTYSGSEGKKAAETYESLGYGAKILPPDKVISENKYKK